MGAAGAVTGIGLAMGVVGGLQAGQAAAAAHKYNARIAERNAAIALEQARTDAEAQDREGRKIIGSIRADYGASGVTSSGSVGDVIEASAALAELDRQNILYKGELKAMGLLEEAALERKAGKQAITQSRFGAASMFLTSAGTIYGLGPKK